MIRLQCEDEKVWIVISWLHQKPADLDLHCFLNIILTKLWSQCVYYVKYGITFIGLDKQLFGGLKIVIIFLYISYNMCFRCSIEPSH